MKGIMSTRTGENKSFIRRYASFVPGCALLFMVGLIPTAQAQFSDNDTVCGSEIKKEVAMALAKVIDASAIEKLAVEAKLYKKYQYCMPSDKLARHYTDLHIAARQCGAKVSNVGDLYFEEMSCCGYDPQRRQFACPVKIKQSFGFGDTPLPGSREYVMHCVENASGVLMPVGIDSVHLANEISGNRPSWQFVVIANANSNLDTVYPMNGDTVRARSILSWGFQPTSCDFQPVWGNALNYNIRLDQ